MKFMEAWAFDSGFFMLKNKFYFLKLSRISIKSKSVDDGPGSTTTAGLFILFAAFMIINNTTAMHRKLINAERKFPYFTPCHDNAAIFSAPTAFNAGFNRSGVITSSTSEETIFPKAAPMITPTAKSTTFPLNANSLKSFHIVANRTYFLMVE